MQFLQGGNKQTSVLLCTSLYFCTSKVRKSACSPLDTIVHQKQFLIKQIGSTQKFGRSHADGDYENNRVKLILSYHSYLYPTLTPILTATLTRTPLLPSLSLSPSPSSRLLHQL